MKTTNNTILITGGSAGIGLEIAKRFSKGNKLIITGRSPQRLERALSELPGATGIVSDVSKKSDVEALVSRVTREFPDLNVVVNNAGRAVLYDIGNSESAAETAQDEMDTNYISVLRLNEKLLPLLKIQDEAAIVNVSSIVAIAPGNLPTYSASKAALHSYTLSLRSALRKNANLKVFELMPPLVNTEFSTVINGHLGIPPAAVAEELYRGFENDVFEIRVGNTQLVYDLYLRSPEEALKLMLPQN